MRLPSSFFFLVSFVFLFYHSTIIVHSKVLCLDNEKHALLDFKLSFFDDPSGFLSNWSSDSVDCCANWDGVGCDPDTGHVTSLYLRGSLKSKQLRPSLLELQHLTSLDLSLNEFTMRIPKFIGSLSELTSLYLLYGGFFGEIPPQLGNLSKLQSLYLTDLDGLYANSLHWLSRLSSLVSLRLSGVNLTNAVDWAPAVQMLPSLSELYCSSCSLPPPILSSTSHVNFSTSLQTLDLSNNSVSSPTFSYLINGTRSLQHVSLDHMKSETNLHEFLESLFAKARYSLEELSLAGNNLNNRSLEVILKFPSLTRLDASSNKVSASLPKVLGYLPTNLTYLDLSSNLLYGVVFDAHLSKFHVLDKLLLSNNNFLKFRFSESWVPPFQLFYLGLSSCKVGPNFPNWILTQNDLRGVDLSNSSISGAIPDAFWNLQDLSYLNFAHNQISGMVPNSPDPSHFSSIDLSYNAFHGPIPPFLFGADILLLSNNKFSSFPLNHPQMPWGSPFSHLNWIINLSKNNISGTLPKWLFQFEELLILNLENKLSGNLPEAIGSLTQLAALHLSNNMFSGQLPSSMKNCTLLDYPRACK